MASLRSTGSENGVSGVYRLNLGGISWSIGESGEAPLQMAIQSPNGHHELIRFTPRRRVWRVNSSLPVFVKQYVPYGWSGALKALLGRDAAAHEWHRLRSVQNLGLPVPTPISLGWRGKRTRTERFLVTESVGEAIPLGMFLYGPKRARGADRWRAIRTVGSLLRKFHDAGVRHRDLHLDNMLIRKRGKEAEVFLIDMQRVDIGRPLNVAARIKSLATLHGGCLEATRTDRLRFFLAYVRDAQEARKNLRGWLAHIEKKAQRHRLRIWRSRGKRCLRENGEFKRLPSQNFLAFGRRHDGITGLQSLAQAPDRLLECSRIVKDSRATTVGSLRLAGRRIFLKRYKHQGIRDALRDLLWSPRGRRIWRAANNCVMRGIAVALPIAYMERCRLGVRWESYLVTMAVEGEPLSQGLAHYCDRFHRKCALMRALALYFRRMHDRGVSHRDLKADHIVVRQEKSGEYRFFIVDFDGLYLGSISWRRRIKDLARLVRALGDYAAMTRTDTARFVKSYLGQRHARRFGEMYKEIARQTQKTSRMRATTYGMFGLPFRAPTFRRIPIRSGGRHREGLH